MSHRQQVSVLIITTLHLAQGRPSILTPMLNKPNDPEDLLELWDFPQSRGEGVPLRKQTRLEPGIDLPEYEDPDQSVSDWVMPPSRNGDEVVQDNEALVNAFLNLPEDIKNSLGNRTLEEQLEHVSENIKDKLTKIQRKLAADIIMAIQRQNANDTSMQLTTPGFFDSFSMVSTFLQSITDVLRMSPGSEKSLRQKRDIVLNSFGEVGEIVNDVANTLLNSVTIWIHRHEGQDCVKRLMCESNRNIFRRGYLIPSVLTYTSNLALSVASDGKVAEKLTAARKGRKGETNCVETYPDCTVKL